MDINVKKDDFINTARIPAELPAPETINHEEILAMYNSGEIDLVCILGPTASGKTKYAVHTARTFNRLMNRERCAEIISADSRQVYRGMDIGTGKDLSEYGEIPYHMTDIAEAGTKYNIYQYQKDFEKVYSEIKSRGGIPVLCGGSGLYIESVTRGYSLPDVPENRDLRRELEKEDTETLIRMLSDLKPLHNSTDFDTRKRLVRAIEIARYEKIHGVSRTENLPKNTYYIGTLVDREERNRRIDIRLEQRLKEGMVEEVSRLLASGIPAEDLIYYGLEYKFITLYLLGELDYAQMKKLLGTAIHQFAKRQMTWFRGMERKGLKIHWTTVPSPTVPNCRDSSQG